MIILQVNFDRVSAVPTESNPPIAAGIDRVTAVLSAFERVKTIARLIQILRLCGRVQKVENSTKPIGVLNAQLGGISRPCELSESLVPE